MPCIKSKFTHNGKIHVNLYIEQIDIENSVVDFRDVEFRLDADNWVHYPRNMHLHDKL